VYGPLLHGCTTIVYEGKPIMTPDAGALWRVIAEYGVKSFFTAPTAFRAVKKEDPDAKLMAHYDLSKLQVIFSAGERLDPPTQEWLTEKSGKTVVDHWWQTETGWDITANLWGVEPKPVKFGSSTLPTPGFDVRILDESGKKLARNEQGYIAIKLPLPPACMNQVWGDDDKFRESYLKFLPGYYTTGDGGYIDDEGYVFVMGRVDDVINVAGHRLSTGEIEEVVAAHPAVAECAVIARDDDLKGQVPMGLVVLKSGASIAEGDLQKELIARIRDTIGAITCYKDTVVLSRLAKTRSGKTLRKTLANIVNGKEYMVPSTIDDPGVIPEIIEALRSKHLVK
jgi:propionyl-CoA synthetase